MTLFTLPTSYGVSQSWDMDFNVLNGKYYPNGFYASIGWKGHNGIDFRCPVGSPVEAVCDGVIEYVGPGNNHPLLSGGGNTLLLRNDELGIRFEYLHLSQQNVYTGQRVKRGQVIARSGNTGISSGAHLHLGAIPVRPNLNNGYRGRVDPTPWLYGPSNPDYAGLAAAGTIQPTTQEDDVALTKEQADAIAMIPRLQQQMNALDDRTAPTEPISKAAALILRKINPTDWEDGNTMFIAAQADIRPPASPFYRAEDGDGSIYELVGGQLRGVTKEEWELRGESANFNTTTQERIDALPKVG